MSATIRYVGIIYDGTESELNSDNRIWKYNDLLFATDTLTIKRGNGVDKYVDLPVISSGRSGGNINISRGTIPGSINKDGSLEMTLATLGFVDTFAGDADTIDINGTGLGVYYLVEGTTNTPTPGGLLIHGQRLVSDGHAEFQLFTSDDPSDPVWDGIYARWRTGQDTYSQWDKIATHNYVTLENAISAGNTTGDNPIIVTGNFNNWDQNGTYLTYEGPASSIFYVNNKISGGTVDLGPDYVEIYIGQNDSLTIRNETDQRSGCSIESRVSVFPAIFDNEAPTLFQVREEIKTVNLNTNQSLIIDDSEANTLFAVNSNGVGLEVPFFASPHTTADRPTLNATDVGAQIYDTTLNRPIWWDGTEWLSYTGIALGDSTATTVDGIVSDFNDLLLILRNAGLIAT